MSSEAYRKLQKRLDEIFGPETNMMSREEWLAQFAKFKRIHAETTIYHSNSQYAADRKFEDSLTDEDREFLKAVGISNSAPIRYHPLSVHRAEPRS